MNNPVNWALSFQIGHVLAFSIATSKRCFSAVNSAAGSEVIIELIPPVDPGLADELALEVGEEDEEGNAEDDDVGVEVLVGDFLPMK